MKEAEVAALLGRKIATIFDVTPGGVKRSPFFLRWYSILKQREFMLLLPV